MSKNDYFNDVFERKLEKTRNLETKQLPNRSLNK